jgi:hypothetical protein
MLNMILAFFAWQVSEVLFTLSLFAVLATGAGVLKIWEWISGR